MAKTTPLTPKQIVARREAAGLTQTQAASLVHSALSSWQHWEAEPGTTSHRQMHLAFWELFLIKTEPMLKARTRKK
jgi:DNA (cytosine-5)-methyltransferase 1